MYQLGFVTGRKVQVIPWGTLAKDPSSWISAECFPNNFEWKDPSKIQVGEIFRLLDHWRDRQVRGLDPLIWVQTCPLFQDAAGHSKHGRTVRRVQVQQYLHDSDEEVFVLPSSQEIDQEDDESDNNDENESSDEAPIVGNCSDDGESMDLDAEHPPMATSHQPGSHSCEHHTLFLDFERITYVPCSNEGWW